MKISSVSFKWQLAYIEQVKSCIYDMQGYICLLSAHLSFYSLQMRTARVERKENITHTCGCFLGHFN